MHNSGFTQSIWLLINVYKTVTSLLCVHSSVYWLGGWATGIRFQAAVQFYLLTLQLSSLLIQWAQRFWPYCQACHSAAPSAINLYIVLPITNQFITLGSVSTNHFTLSEISAAPYTNTHILHCLTRADGTYRFSRNVCNGYRSALRNIADERRSDTYRPLKPELSSTANNIYTGAVQIHILQQATGNVTQLSNCKLTKQITKPHVLLYTAEGRAMWLSLQNMCIVTDSLYAVCPRKTLMAVRDTDFISTINFFTFNWPHGLTSSTHTQHTGQFCSFELRAAISNLQLRQAEQPAACWCISFGFKRHKQ
jgi:hypothetical protein